jgi:hypothetical protein
LSRGVRTNAYIAYIILFSGAPFLVVPRSIFFGGGFANNHDDFRDYSIFLSQVKLSH